MLLGLRVKNFAIIEDISIQFDKGMTVLTGETGAGKSLIIDSISLLMGDRSSKDLIRKGEKKAFIQGIYNYENKNITEYLNNNNIEIFENLNLTREIFDNGKSILKVNNEITSLQDFKAISKLITDIHLQHDNIKFFDEEKYIELIDTYDSSIKDDITIFRSNYDNYLDLLSEYKLITKENNDFTGEIDFIRFKLEELKELNLSTEEYSKLSKQIDVQSNSDEIYNVLSASNSLISANININLFETVKKFSNIVKYKESYSTLNDRLNNLYFELEDINTEISNEINLLEFNPNELLEIKDRYSIYETTKRKYNCSIKELGVYMKTLEEKIEKSADFEFNIEKLKSKIDFFYNKCLKNANIINTKRKTICKKLESLLIEELNDLDLINISINFRITIPKTGDPFINIFNKNGFDKIEFFISTNKNENLQLLSKVASGGELSRIMLALKSIFSKKQSLSTIILDEIDTGVSGETAFKISTKIKNISKHTQLLCITHMPQVAAAADNHIYIYKELKNNRVITRHKKLSNKEKINEIAKMINGNNIDENSIEHAKKIIQSVNK